MATQVLAVGDVVTDSHRTYTARVLKLLDGGLAFVELVERKPGVVMPRRFAVSAAALARAEAR
jgi:hypothetical protein